jgi:catalase
VIKVLPKMQSALKPPYSYAEATFYPIHAYGWVAADGTKRWIRYRLVPHATADDRLPEKFSGKDRLREEIAARLARGPVRHDLLVTVAEANDDPHDPTSVWKSRRELTAGTVEVSGEAPDPEADGGVVVFDPTRAVPGIELSDDPILHYRSGAYSVSVERRIKR